LGDKKRGFFFSLLPFNWWNEMKDIDSVNEKKRSVGRKEQQMYKPKERWKNKHTILPTKSKRLEK